MTGCYDSEQQRIIDQIKCVAYREARNAGAGFIDRQWIAQKLHRSVRWVFDNWRRLKMNVGQILDEVDHYSYPRRAGTLWSLAIINSARVVMRYRIKFCRNVARKLTNQQSTAISSAQV